MGQTSKNQIQIITFSIRFFDDIALNLMSSFLPLFVMQEFGANLLDATFWTGIALLFKQSSYAAGSPIWGWLSEKVGSRKMLIRVMAGHGLAHFLMFLSGNVYQFTAFLCLDGALGSMSTPVFVLLANTMSPKELPQAVSYQQSAATIGGFVGPAIGGVLAYSLGFRPTYLIASIIFFILVVPVVLLRYEEALSKPEEAKSKAPVTEKVMGNLRFLNLDFAGLILSFAAVGFITPIIPLSLKTLGVDQDSLLAYTTVYAIVSALCYGIASPLGTRYIKRHFLPILALAATLMVIAPIVSIGVIVFLVLMVGMRTVQAPIHSYLLAGSGEKRRRGVQMGILNSGRYIGGAIGPFIASSVAATLGLPQAFACMAAIQFATTMVLVVQNRRLEKSSTVKTAS